MLLRDLLNHIEAEFPAETAFPGDPVGLQIQSGRSETAAVCVTLDLTEDVADEAIRRGADCIVTFHPCIFTPLRTITDESRAGRVATRLIRAGVAVIALHTNFDAHPRGTNAVFGGRLGLRDMRPLVPDARRAGFGIGVVGTLPVAVAPELLAEMTAELCGAPVIIAPKAGQTGVQTVAVVCGSGFSFLDAAIASGADAFITADVKYHGYHAAAERLALISPGHYEMEQFVPAALAQELRSLTGGAVNVFTAQTATNPVRYAAPPAA